MLATSTTFACDGLGTIDAHLAPQTTAKCRRDGLLLHHPDHGTALVPTDRPPEPGAKVTAFESLHAICASPFVARLEPGGGAVRVSAALARYVSRTTIDGNVHLINSGTDAPELDRVRASDRLVRHSLGRQATPINLICPGANLTVRAADRIVIKSPVASAPAGLDGAARRAVNSITERAGAVVSVSSKDAALTATVASCTGARRYYQPPGSLSPEMNRSLLHTAHEAICNFEEWHRLGRDAGLTVPEIGEDSPEAPETAAALLRALYKRRWAGIEAAVCTLGRRGVVVADWPNDRVYHIGLELPDDDPGVPTPAGAGDRFLAEWVYWRETWSRRGHLRDPLAANGQRAVRAVAQTLGLRRNRFDTTTRVC